MPPSPLPPTPHAHTRTEPIVDGGSLFTLYADKGAIDMIRTELPSTCTRIVVDGDSDS